MSEPRHLALLVGVDRYRYLLHHQLRSCVNDARLLADTLAGRYGFQPQDTTLLLDEAATRAAILDGLGRLRRGARPGDAVVFFFSGHGSRIADLGGGESDGWSESLVPHDSGRAPDPNRDIADDEIHDWLLAVSEVTRNVVVIADSCFAAGVARDVPAGGGVPEKWLPEDPRPRRRRRRSASAAHPAVGFPALAPSRAADTGALAAQRDAGPSGFLPLDERYTLLAACRAGEGAKELKSRPQSAFTSFLCQELWRAPATATYREVIDRVRLALATEVQDQVPQVEGARDRVLFGEATGRPAPFLPLLERHNGEVVLDGGIVHGVAPGSIWAIYPSGTRRPAAGGVPLGTVRIASAQAERSRGVIVEEQGAIEAGARAFACAPGPCPPRLAVLLADSAARQPAAAAFAASIAASPLLVLQATGEGGAVRILAADPGKPTDSAGQPGTAGGGDALPPPAAPAPLSVDEPSWAALSAEGQLLLPPIDRRRQDAIPTLVSGIESLARARNLLAITPGFHAPKEPGEPAAPGEPGQPGEPTAPGAPGAPPAGGVAMEIELLRRRGSGSFEVAHPDAGGEVVYEAGDRFALRITHHDPQPLYLQVLDVGLLSAITVLHPPAGDIKALAPGLTFEIGTRPGEELILGLPPGLEKMARATGRPLGEGREALKIFLTAGATDLSLWQQEGYRDAARDAAGANPDRWAERTLTFLVRGASVAVPSAVAVIPPAAAAARPELAASPPGAALDDRLQRQADAVVAVTEAGGVRRVIVAAQ